MPEALRARLLLWRDLAIHLLSRSRHEAITEGLQNDHHPQLSLASFGKGHAALVARTIADAYHKCAASQQAAFKKKWINRGIFLREEAGELVFHLMTTAMTTSAS